MTTSFILWIPGCFALEDPGLVWAVPMEEQKASNIKMLIIILISSNLFNCKLQFNIVLPDRLSFLS